MVILLDNGHAKCTPGKRSPYFEDGSQFFEYEFNREIVKRISQELDKLGIVNHILVPEILEDVCLTKRANRANGYCNKYGKENCLFISIHVNAGGDGYKWMKCGGWSVYTSKGKTKSDEYATIFFEEAEKLLKDKNITLRQDCSDNDPDFEENFTVLCKTKCPAVLTENLFMDNEKEVNFLKSENGKRIITDIHINAIKRICGLTKL